MKSLKKILSVFLSVMMITGSFVVAQVAMADEVSSNYSVTLSANGKNKTILTGAKDNANNNYSTISLTGGTVDHINAWLTNDKGSMISKYKYKVPMKTTDKKLYYKDGESVSKGTTTSILIEQNNVASKTAKGNANIK